MSLMYNGKNINEEDLLHCAKCDCLIIPDSQSDVRSESIVKCLATRIKSLENKTVTTSCGESILNCVCESAESSEVCCHSTVKIYVHRSNLVSSDSEKSHSESPAKDVRKKRSIKDSMFLKKLCCKKTKGSLKKDKSATIGPESKDNANQTSKAKVANRTTQDSRTTNVPPPSKTTSKSEIKEIFDKYVYCSCGTNTAKDIYDKYVHGSCNGITAANVAVPTGCCPGGCNTNTIIFPKDRSAGDSCINQNLHEIIKFESRNTHRLIEDILCELQKQKREIKEMKEMLDMFLRMMREQLFMMSSMGVIDSKYKKAFENNFDTVYNNNLERKSNTLSMVEKKDGAENQSETKAVVESVKTTEPEKKKKRYLCSWCK